MKRVPKIKITSENHVERQFIEGRRRGFQWDNADERIIKAFNLRLPEPLHMKLQFIADHTPHSIHSFVMGVVEQAVEKELAKLIQQ